MNDNQRKRLLVFAAGGVVGLYLLDLLVITPATQSWVDQSERINALDKKVTRGEALVEREDRIRKIWAGMMRANLPPDNSAAEDAAYRAFNRWVQDSGVTFNSLTPQWQTHDDGYETLELRATATGDQVSLGKFIYALEVDPLPVNLEECEITTRDTHGSQLTMAMRCSFARLATAINSATSSNSGSGNNNNSSGRNRQ